jgi:RimJ/RimL family protein N-acetyltransferase
MELRRYRDDDLELTEALECDPGVMGDLGGPADPADLVEAHARRVADEWYLTIVPRPGGPPAGTIGIWDSELHGSPIHEVGWMVLPAAQGRGVASRALGLLIERAREEPRFEWIHAFPAVSNAPSNALCRKFGFELVGHDDFVFRGRRLHCHHWQLDVRGPRSARPGA